MNVATAAHVACVWEALARKVGNVHRTADFPGTTLSDFLLSAGAVSPVLGRATTEGVGATVFQAVAATAQIVGQNTNLGIILLLAPLAAVPEGTELEAGVGGVLARLTVADARQVYAAIRLAKPGGLGTADTQDVAEEPTVTLLEAMALAADRDLIARQYAGGYAEVFGVGVPALLDGSERFGCVEAGVIHCHLVLLATFTDSLIARKRGAAVADAVRLRAADVLVRGGLGTAGGRRAGVELDRHLRSDGHALNPGTAADLVAACLFAALREDKLTPARPFPWPAPDWL